ncbi:Histidine--tRNA ligase [bioreactor metagenome]|uniref:histidine--tRNA ligase n=1 Tax=bioreactor metagenome TaxID=1076179 RepID=A0A645GQ54_9ZZZZ
MAMKIEFKINPKIVRGLDYYTKTIFEFVSTDIGAQGTVCGGGRYDGLVKEMGGNHTPSLGFAMGIERLMLLMQKQGVVFPEARTCDIFIASIGEEASLKAAEIVTDLRAGGVSAQFDVAGRSVKAQMKFAGKIGANYSMVLGEEEIKNAKAALKNMETGETKEVDLATFADEFLNISVQEAAKNLGNYISDAGEMDLSKLLGGLE